MASREAGPRVRGHCCPGWCKKSPPAILLAYPDVHRCAHHGRNMLIV